VRELLIFLSLMLRHIAYVVWPVLVLLTWIEGLTSHALSEVILSPREVGTDGICGLMGLVRHWPVHHHILKFSCLTHGLVPNIKRLPRIDFSSGGHAKLSVEASVEPLEVEVRYAQGLHSTGLLLSLKTRLQPIQRTRS
jgi:hypothetical protein